MGVVLGLDFLDSYLEFPRPRVVNCKYCRKLLVQHAKSRTFDGKKYQPLVNYPGLALAIAHCMRLGDLYQLACADKLLDQNPPPWSPPKAGIWAMELIYIV